MTVRVDSSGQRPEAGCVQQAPGTGGVLSDRRHLAAGDEDVRAYGSIPRDHRPAGDCGDIHEPGVAVRLSASGDVMARTRPEVTTILGMSSRSTTSVSPPASGSGPGPARKSRSAASAALPGG